MRVEVEKEPLAIQLTFIDRGIPYDPVEKEDLDITLPLEKRTIGGMGIFMVKQSMDDVSHEYRDGQNILQIKKRIR